MVIILDDVIPNLSNIKETISNTLKNNNFNIDWCHFDDDHKFKNFCLKFIDIASTYYDLSSCIGYEFWTHNNTRPPQGWHYDRDEFLFEKNGTYDYPLCSIVYYPIVENLEGGQLHLECDIITPKENRLIIFPPKTHHYVEPFKGNRVSILVNPWSKILKPLDDSK